jgi:exodeoxyribonuclease V alpha subunit
MIVELRGELEKITYVNEVNNFTVAKVKVKGQKELVPIVGSLASVTIGEILKMKGVWINHVKYGSQFKIHQYETVTPATAHGIKRYLGSGLIKGIGPIMAKRLVDQFGVDTLDIIDTSIERLHEVNGIGTKRIEMIQKAWQEQKHIRDVMLFLQNHDISATFASKIFKQYGQKSIEIVEENPYRLATDIFGIGFLTADKIAEKLGIKKDSQIRAEAGILHVLNQVSNEGHVYYPYELLIRKCEEMLETEREIIVQAFGTISQEKKIIIEDLNKDDFKENNKAVYLTKFYVSETGIAKNLSFVLKAPKVTISFDRDKAIEWVQEAENITLAESQKLAIREAMDKKVLVITGGPGVGKTTVINAIIKVYQKLGERILLAAPTGRAAKKMSEATHYQAKTIHRLLDFSPKSGGFTKNEHNPLDAGLIVIDETSMVDTILMYHFLKAVPLHATLILVGDVDQLPSVGAGNVLRDIIASGCVPTVTLTEIFRQSQKSLIITNAHRVNKGDFPYIDYKKDRPQDFYFIEVEEPEEASQKIIEYCKKRIPEKFDFHAIDDIQVITPMHRGVLGSTYLNSELQKALNSSSHELDRHGKILKINDKVMQIRNNYEKNVFNGDIGKISSINKEDREVGINFDGRIIIYDFMDLDEIVLAYAISIHKAQGSEYPVVVMPIHTQHYILLQRNLLYTGITRGKRLVVIIGTKKALSIAIRNNKPGLRYTLLEKRLQSALVTNDDRIDTLF